MSCISPTKQKPRIIEDNHSSLQLQDNFQKFMKNYQIIINNKSILSQTLTMSGIPISYLKYLSLQNTERIKTSTFTGTNRVGQRKILLQQKISLIVHHLLHWKYQRRWVNIEQRSCKPLLFLSLTSCIHCSSSRVTNLSWAPYINNAGTISSWW